MSARRRTKAQGPTSVEAIVHDDKRVNLPTADAQEFVTPEVEQVRQVVLERDPTLDPQLVWRGKYPDDDIEQAQDLVTDAPPIYIQEKIDPRVLIEDLRRTAAKPQDEPELTLFDTFDGLDELDLVEFYKHPANWSNRMVLGDSLQVMSSLSEREQLRGTVQMIYIDPPYGIKFGSNWQASARRRDVKDGKAEDAAREAEQIKAFRDTWELGIHSYLSYLRDRLLAARELLTESGSCFVQIGDENVHLVRSLMDEVFGPENFVSQIVFVKTGGFSSQHLPRNFDNLLWYGTSLSSMKFHGLFEKYDTDPTTSAYRWVRTPEGVDRALTKQEVSGEQGLPQGIFYQPTSLNSQGASRAPQPFEFRGRSYRPPSGNHWKASWPDGMGRLAQAGRLHVAKDSLRFRRLATDFPWKSRTSVWTDTATGNFTEDKLYVVQSNAKVVERCMLMCTDPGDLVLDPTCGSGTTAYVAEQWGRRWITIDTSRVALALARQRLMGGRYPYYLLADSEAGRAKEEELTGMPRPDARPRGDIRQGFVYERVPHITLKSIANNPDIREGMTREQIDEAIRRHADDEVLYDRPYEDKRAVRVTGPFTVESLSPHRSLAFVGSEDGHRESISERRGAEEPDGARFEQMILDNLAKSGVQNGRRGERIEFASLEEYAGRHIQAVGVQQDGDGNGTQDGRRIGIAIGPQYGTVDQRFVKDAVREAIRANDIDVLCVLGFAFDAQAGEVTEADGVTVDTRKGEFAEVDGERRFGVITLLTVRMNVDLLMGESLKKSAAGNLFTVFGEPDITVDAAGDEVTVELHGVDVYDPTTGQVRPSNTDQIALWMIDTDYDGESFFVRHCYFTGGGDPYKRLKTALKADIDVDAWASLNSTVSRPFPRPYTGQIAVKVINDYGDEVMKVYQVADDR